MPISVVCHLFLAETRLNSLCTQVRNWNFGSFKHFFGFHLKLNMLLLNLCNRQWGYFTFELVDNTLPLCTCDSICCEVLWTRSSLEMSSSESCADCVHWWSIMWWCLCAGNRAGSTRLWVMQRTTSGSGISMTRWKVLTGSETRMLYSTCVKRPLLLLLRFSILTSFIVACFELFGVWPNKLQE